MEGKGESSQWQRDPFAARAWEIHPRDSQRFTSPLLKGNDTMLFLLNRLMLLFYLGLFCLFCFAIFNTSRMSSCTYFSIACPADRGEWTSVIIAHDWAQIRLWEKKVKQMWPVLFLTKEWRCLDIDLSLIFLEHVVHSWWKLLSNQTKTQYTATTKNIQLKFSLL